MKRNIARGGNSFHVQHTSYSEELVDMVASPLPLHISALPHAFLTIPLLPHWWNPQATQAEMLSIYSEEAVPTPSSTWPLLFIPQ